MEEDTNNCECGVTPDNAQVDSPAYFSDLLNETCPAESLVNSYLEFYLLYGKLGANGGRGLNS